MSATRAFLTAGLALCLGANAHTQSLGEIAKRTQEQRDKAKTDGEKATAGRQKEGTAGAKAAPKVITNKDLAALPSAAPTPTTDTAPAPDPARDTPISATNVGKADDAKSAAPAKDEAWWRARMAGLRATLEQAQSIHAAKLVLVVRLAGVRDNVPDRGFSVAQAYASASAELAKARADAEVAAGAVSRAKAAIDAAEEEARRARVLPGWLR